MSKVILFIWIISGDSIAFESIDGLVGMEQCERLAQNFSDEISDDKNLTSLRYECLIAPM
jgi:hypothetical protein